MKYYFIKPLKETTINIVTTDFIVQLSFSDSNKMVKDWDSLQQHDSHHLNDAVESCDGDDARSRNSKDKRQIRKSYPSNVQGRFIVNAITGIAYPWRVGSLYEDLLWKVCDSKARRGKLEPDMYFYDSPKQAINHRRYRPNVYTVETLEWWKMRVAKMTKLLQQEEEEKEASKF